MSNFIPLLIINIALLFTAGILGGIALRAHYERSPGLSALLYPFIFLFVSGFLEAARMLGEVCSIHLPVLATMAGAWRILNGLGWFLMCHAHLKLHGVLGWRRRLTIPVVAVTTAISLSYGVAVMAGAGQAVIAGLTALGLGVMSATAFYAAISAILTLRLGLRLWPSSQAGIRMALFAIVIYPVSLLAERFGFNLTFLDPQRTVFEQLYPLYMIVFAALALPAILAQSKGALAEPGDARAAESLTERERAVALLLRDGKTLKEIAIELSVSVATVKSHSSNAYRKLGVSGRKELALVRL